MADNVTAFTAGRMTEADYDRERARLRELYGDSSTEAVARRDQALAKLFYVSGWNQDRLATKEGVSRQRVAQKLLFARFLSFATAVANPGIGANNLTEYRWRYYWLQTDGGQTGGTDGGNERQRFTQVLRLMEAEATLRAKPRHSIAAPLIGQFADGKWHHIETIASRLQTDEDHVISTIADSLPKLRTSRVKVESKQVGTKKSYRIFKQEKTVGSDELAEKLGPIIQGLKEEGKKNVNTMSPGTVARLAALLQKQLDEWTE